ncbi:MAG: deoxynucleoside kinase [Patescibacteria group bacterium]
MNKFIAIAGNIGVGKTTLSKRLAEFFGGSVSLEPFEENPYLKDFYNDMKAWAFHSQMFFLGKKLENHLATAQNPGFKIQDRSIYEDAEVFAKNLYRSGLILERDWQVYWRVYKTGLKILPPPDLIIYLKASVDTVMRRIKKRGRDFEEKMPREYIDNLNKLYEEWTSGFQKSPILTVDYDKVDLKHNPEDFNDFIKTVGAIIGGH